MYIMPCILIRERNELDEMKLEDRDLRRDIVNSVVDMMQYFNILDLRCRTMPT